MLFSNLNNKSYISNKIFEGNFISKDFTGIFDKEADYNLTKLTIDKMFEGLDLEKSDKIHNTIASDMPSLKDAMGVSKADDTFAFRLIELQLDYIKTRLTNIETEIAKINIEILAAANKSKTPEQVREAILSLTGPEGISSIYPKVSELFLNVSKSVDFKTSEKVNMLKKTLNALAALKVEDLIKGTLDSLKNDAGNKPLKSIYEQIDVMELKEIESDYLNLTPENFVGTPFKINDLIKSNDIYYRLAGFFDFCITTTYSFGKKVMTEFGKDYSKINKLGGNKVVVPATSCISLIKDNKDYEVDNEEFAQFLTEVGSLLINRVFSNSSEDIKNIFTPSLQVFYVSLLSILSFRLINFSISIEDVVSLKTQEIAKSKKTQESVEKNNRRKIVVNASKNLEDDGFYNANTPNIRVGTRYDSEIIKSINNFLIGLNLLPSSKTNSDSFDEITKEAVKVFQKQSEIRVDGIIGRNTRAKMKLLADDAQKSLKKQGVSTETPNTEGITG
jgi:hypothetical protein